MTLVILVLVFLLSIQAPPQATVAPTPDALVADYVAAFNAGEAAMRQFFEKYADQATPVDARIARYRSMKTDLGTLKIRRLASTDPTAITVETVDQRGTVTTLVFQLTADDRHRLRAIQVRIGGPGGDDQAGPPLSARDEKTALGDVAAFFTKAASADQFSGTGLVARGGKVLWERAVGQADKDKKIPNTIDTKFNIGSIGKSFTVVAIAQLVAAGKIAPEDTVGKFLPAYPNAAVREKVTVQQLLDMRSGIGDFFGTRYQSTPKSQVRSLQDYLPLFASDPLLFEPGQGQQYSNGGYVVLGLIIEQASGMSYYDYVQKRIFDVAAMANTGLYPEDARVSTRATGYTLSFGAPRRANTETLPGRASSAGGACSTLHDLLRYEQSLAAGKLVAPDAMRRIGRPTSGMGIAGGAPGLNAALDTDVNGYTVIVLANYDPPAAERLSAEIRRVLNSVKR
jgi:CubicO group peptidase (beta-lactamase class C family)